MIRIVSGNTLLKFYFIPQSLCTAGIISSPNFLWEISFILVVWDKYRQRKKAGFTRRYLLGTKFFIARYPLNELSRINCPLRFGSQGYNHPSQFLTHFNLFMDQEGLLILITLITPSHFHLRVINELDLWVVHPRWGSPLFGPEK